MDGIICVKRFRPGEPLKKSRRTKEHRIPKDMYYPTC